MASGRILDLLQLQNLTKRDPQAYRDEFLQQFNHFKTQLSIFQLKPTKDYKHFAQLVSYLSHVCKLYPKEMSEFPKQIASLLESSCNNLEPDLRRILVKSLILMRNRELLPQTDLLELFFKLFRVHDKPLRKLLYSYIVADIKVTNQKSKNMKLNRSLQNFMFEMLNDNSEIASKMSLKVMVELFRKKIWHDPKTVNVISNAVFSKNSKIIITALNFFLHIDNPDKVDSDEEEDAEKTEKAKNAYRKTSHALKVAKKTKSRKGRVDRSKVDLKKAKEEAEKKLNPNFPAIELIHDPQGYSEKLFNLLQKTTESFDTRIIMMNFISRLIFTHKLMLYNFYPFLQKYLQPNQKDVTYVLAILAQSCHELVDPDVLKPLVMTIAKYFVNDGCNPEVIAIGLNTIRAIVGRCPLAMEKVLLSDLIQYKDKKEKGVKMASNALLNFFRDNYPSMLPRKDRGRNKTDVKPLEFGATKVSQGVEGIELLYDEELNKQLEEMEENGEIIDMDEDDNNDGWEEVSDDDDDEEEEESNEEEGEWLEVNDNDIKLSDVSDDSDDSDDEFNEEDWEEVSGDEEDFNDEDMEEISDDEEVEEEEEEEEEEVKVEVKPKLKQTNTKQKKDDDEDLGIQVLSNEDLEKIKKLRNLKRKLSNSTINIDDEDEDTEHDHETGYITADDLQGSHKKRKMNAEERRQTVLAGREGRVAYGNKASRKEEKKSGKSMSNEKKAKANKPFMLMKQSRSVRIKQLLSIRDRQIKKTAHIEKQKKGRY